jgi:hypothetical protein
MQALGHAVDEEVGHGEFAQVPAREGLVLLPRPVGDLTDGRAAEQAGPRRVLKGGLDVAIAGARLGAVLVVPAADGLGHLRLQRFLHDLAHGQLEQLGAGVAVGHALALQLLKLLARPLRCRYSSRGHGDASSCRRRQPATLGLGSKQECIPASLSSNSRTSPR